MGFSCVMVQLRRSSHYTSLSSKKVTNLASPLNAAHQNLPFPPNRTLTSKANAINQAWTKSIFFKKY